METVKRTTVVGIFDEPESARDAIQALKNSGFDGQDIGVLMKDRELAKGMAEETGSHAGEGALTGAVGGGLLGGLAGWLVGIGSLAIPGVGPFIAAGAIGSALAGAGIGASVGAIGGALVGLGVPKEEAEFYEGEVRKGRTLVTVKADGRYGEAHSILRRFGAYDIENRYAGRPTMDTHGVAPGVSGWDEGTVNPREPKANEHWEEEARSEKLDREYEDSRSGPRVDGNEYEITGGEGYPAHDHRFVGDRCELCGAIRRLRRAA